MAAKIDLMSAPTTGCQPSINGSISVTDILDVFEYGIGDQQVDGPQFGRFRTIPRSAISDRLRSLTKLRKVVPQRVDAIRSESSSRCSSHSKWLGKA